MIKDQAEQKAMFSPLHVSLVTAHVLVNLIKNVPNYIISLFKDTVHKIRHLAWRD